MSDRFIVASFAVSAGLAMAGWLLFIGCLGWSFIKNLGWFF